MRLSKKADYALIAMKHLALRGDRGSSSAREIAELYDIPIELMAKVLQRLVRRPPSIFDYAYEDFEVVGYEHHPAIRAPVAV